ncbi:alpha/beta fold hydrolase [Rhodococcoides fascians]|uniref:alpha/beta fold hydrolase n=1 Tax=Rhodococcoides fascians TaxID=1828 RepID=UPI00055BADC3|nr:alpha/beta hydrolase [Rhodococcus fascians]
MASDEEFPLVHGTAELADVRLHYVRAGQGEPLLLIHGWPQTWFAWRKIIPLLSTRYTVIAPDLRGLGDSTRPTFGYDKRTLAGDLHHLMHNELGFEKFFVTGHDWGGVVAFSLAAHHPESVTKLAVIDVAIPGDGSPDISQGGKRWHHGFHKTASLPEDLIEGREEIYLRWFFENYGHSRDAISDSDIIEYVRSYKEPGALKAGFELYRAIDQDIQDNEAVAKRGLLAVPVLAVGGSGTWGRGTETADSLRRMAADVTEIVIAEAGHWVPEEQPVQLAQSLDSFFSA